ncbi:MAG: hypothetical protein RLZZ546_625 [Bacteroidota bacterium]|jgi:hypothetical protein
MDTNEVLARILIYFIVHFSTWIIIYLRPTSSRLKVHEIDPRSLKHELATKIVSSIHAFVTFVLSLYYLGYLLLNKDINSILQIENKDDFFQNLCCYSSAFFICDIMLCLILYKENGPLFIIHAFSGFIGTMYGSLLNESHTFIALLFLWEGSTPFLNLRWILMEYGFKDTKLFKITNIILAVLFIIFRILIGIPVTLYVLHLLYHHEKLPLFVRVAMISACISTIFLNLNWGRIITSKAVKSFFQETLNN